jgi:hypothetical protein
MVSHLSLVVYWINNVMVVMMSNEQVQRQNIVLVVEKRPSASGCNVFEMRSKTSTGASGAVSEA